MRSLCALISGMIISQTGSLIQLSTRNILASPSTLGFDGMSVFWILIFHSLILLFNQESSYALLFLIGLPLFILLGIGFSAFLFRVKNVDRLILLGLTFNLLVGGIFSFCHFVFLAFNLPFPVELWFGHFRYADSTGLILIGIVEIALILNLFFIRQNLALFSLGENVSRNFRLNFRKIYLSLFISIAVGTFAVISLFGAFSFLGLIFPLVARKLWFRKMDLQGELILGSLCNGLILMILDGLCFFFPIYGAEVPVGLIVTIVGAVSLIFLLWNSNSGFEILAKKEK